jgi:hypothetical protein
MVLSGFSTASVADEVMELGAVRSNGDDREY